MAGARLAIVADRTEWLAVIHCCGEIDQSSVADLEAVLGLAVLSGVPVVRLDLRSVDFCDSSGLHCLLSAAAACEEAGKTFELDPGATVSRLLEMCGMGERFNIARPRSAAPSAAPEFPAA